MRFIRIFDPGAASRFCGRHPLFAAALVAAACVVGANVALGIALGLAGGFGLLGFAVKSWKVGVAWFICGAISSGVFTVRMDRRTESEKNLLSAEGGRMIGRVLSDPKGTTRFWSAPVRISSHPHTGSLVWWEGRGELPVAGSVVHGSGSFGKLPRARNPGEFDFAGWLRSRGIPVIFHASWLAGGVETGPIARFGAHVKREFRRSVTAGLPDDSQEAQVIRAMVIGEQPPDAEELVAAFRNSGTLHAFSVSGLHVAMVGSIGWVVLRLFGMPRRLAVIFLLPLIFGYSWITGNSPPAVRSAWMLSIFLGAFVSRRKPDLLNALGAVLLVAALWDGMLLFQPGVQLSYGVTAAIAIGSSLATRAFSWMAKPELHVPLTEMSKGKLHSLRWRRRLAQNLGVSLAAFAGSTPLTAVHFGLITPISIFAGLPLMILIYLMISLSLAAAVSYQISARPAEVLNQFNRWVAVGCVKTVEWFSSIPGGHFQLREGNDPYLLVYQLDRGAGAACFSGVRDGAVLLDCGDAGSFKRRVAPSLRRLGVAPDSVIFSHPDGSHLGGGSRVWQTFELRQALLPVRQSRSPTFREWMEKAPLAGVRVLQVGEIGQLSMPDGATMEPLNVPDADAGNIPADLRVAVFRLHWRGWKILFTSDAGAAVESDLLSSGKNLSADLIIAGNNPNSDSLGDDFLDAVDPSAIIASNSPFPISEKLDPAQVAYWKSRGIQVIDQAASGGVTLTIDSEGQLVLKGFADDSVLTLTPRH